MTGIYFDPSVRLKAHSAVTKGGKSSIKIELETADHFDLASILGQLDKIDHEQRERAKPAKKAAPVAAKKAPLQLSPPLLQIADLREND